ncbi:hypothetical protein L3X38_005389 [Prunus dulcis]|uniref:Uncharacterized protein n=1 Tax=Prunus dulcis TaxID=3755 RepID=A0AAD4ZQQ1_PRUDU|nr:hypothetical protein L3X38_005389 [Prunus dulcis]
MTLATFLHPLLWFAFMGVCWVPSCSAIFLFRRYVTAAADAAVPASPAVVPPAADAAVPASPAAAAVIYVQHIGTAIAIL